MIAQARSVPVAVRFSIARPTGLRFPNQIPWFGDNGAMELNFLYTSLPKTMVPWSQASPKETFKGLLFSTRPNQNPWFWGPGGHRSCVRLLSEIHGSANPRCLKRDIQDSVLYTPSKRNAWFWRAGLPGRNLPNAGLLTLPTPNPLLHGPSLPQRTPPDFSSHHTSQTKSIVLGGQDISCLRVNLGELKMCNPSTENFLTLRRACTGSSKTGKDSV